MEINHQRFLNTGLRLIPSAMTEKKDFIVVFKSKITSLKKFQGDIGPFSPAIPVDVPLWMAINLKQRQKCHIQPPAWMDVGK